MNLLEQALNTRIDHLASKIPHWITPTHNFYDSDTFLDEIEKYTYCDVITLSVFKHFPIPIRRCICTIPNNTTHCLKVKVYSDVHAKLYICYDRKDKHKASFIGSANAHSGYFRELMYKLPDPDDIYAKDYFDKLWKANS